MKTLKTICTATILALTLSVSAYAGDISTPGAPCPGDQETPGITTTDATSTTSDTVDSSDLVEILLSLAFIF